MRPGRGWWPAGAARAQGPQWPCSGTSGQTAGGRNVLVLRMAGDACSASVDRDLHCGHATLNPLGGLGAAG